jgi:uncharacterized protein
MGYDAQGRCPMLVNDACSIYEHRPRTCRTYDCRIFPATGLDADADKPDIRAQSARWRFEGIDSDPEAAAAQIHLRSVAAYLSDHSEVFGPGGAPHTATQLAVASIEIDEALANSPVEADLIGTYIQTRRPPRP